MCLSGLKIITKAKEKEDNMETAKFLKEATRMCRAHTACVGCPVDVNVYCSADVINRGIPIKEIDYSKYVEIVEKWSNEHPVKTRQSELLKMFPNAATFRYGTYSICDICPTKLDATIECEGFAKGSCYECKRKYWLTEVE